MESKDPFLAAEDHEIPVPLQTTTGMAARGSAQDSAPRDKAKVYVFDGEELLDIFTDSPDNAKMLLSHFLERCAAQVNAMAALIQEQNWPEAYRTAHSIKGSARMLSGAELGNSASVLEKACKQTDVPNVEPAMRILIESFTRFKNAAEEFIQS